MLGWIAAGLVLLLFWGVFAIAWWKIGDQWASAEKKSNPYHKPGAAPPTVIPSDPKRDSERGA